MFGAKAVTHLVFSFLGNCLNKIELVEAIESYAFFKPVKQKFGLMEFGYTSLLFIKKNVITKQKFNS